MDLIIEQNFYGIYQNENLNLVTGSDLSSSASRQLFSIRNMQIQ